VAPDTGLTAKATTAGLVTGTGLFPGRLTTRPTTTGVLGGRSCGPGHSASIRSLSVQGASYSINDDTLTCFMTDPTMPLSTIASPSYSGGPALDPSIYSSPRFCYVPVLKEKPGNGASADYWIIDFRPGFITGESSTSTYNNQTFVGASSDNGVVLDQSGNRIETLGVVFFNANALPRTGGEIGGYLGVGPVVTRLAQ